MNDTSSAEYAQFIKCDENMASRFDCKPTAFLVDGKKSCFNGEEIAHLGESYFTTQPDQIWKHKELSESNLEKPKFVAEHAMGTQIAGISLNR